MSCAFRAGKTKLPFFVSAGGQTCIRAKSQVVLTQRLKREGWVRGGREKGIEGEGGENKEEVEKGVLGRKTKTKRRRQTEENVREYF